MTFDRQYRTTDSIVHKMKSHTGLAKILFLVDQFSTTFAT